MAAAAAAAATHTPATTFQLDFMGYAVEWSPFDATRLAVSTAQHFGIVGQGKQYVLQLQHGILTPTAVFDTPDGVYDCTWSESVDTHLAFALANGSVNLWDLKTNKLLREWREHTAEVYAVDWNLVNKEQLLSGAWDNTIKLYHPDESGSIATFREHSKCIYSVQWHPRHADQFASTSGDNTLKIWDVNDRRSGMTIHAHQFEVLTCDWNKYNEFLITTGSVDKSIRTWDIRNPRAPVTVLEGHEFAVRRLKCSPHHANVIASASYDMTSIVWDSSVEDSVLCKFEEHTEFVLGVDFNLFNDGQIATTAWDETVRVFKYMPDMGRNRKPRQPLPGPAAAGSGSASSAPAAS